MNRRNHNIKGRSIYNYNEISDLFHFNPYRKIFLIKLKSISYNVIQFLDHCNYTHLTFYAMISNDVPKDLYLQSTTRRPKVNQNNYKGRDYNWLVNYRSLSCAWFAIYFCFVCLSTGEIESDKTKNWNKLFCI